MKWEEISKEKNLTIKFLQEHKKDLNWKHVSAHSRLSKELMKTFPKHLMWLILVKNSSLTMELIEEIKDESFTRWDMIAMAYPITKEFHDQFKNYIDHSLLNINPNRKIDVEKITKKCLLPSGETITESEYIVTEKQEEPSSPQALTFKVIKNRKKFEETEMEFHFASK